MSGNRPRPGRGGGSTVPLSTRGKSSNPLGRTTSQQQMPPPSTLQVPTTPIRLHGDNRSPSQAGSSPTRSPGIPAIPRKLVFKVPQSAGSASPTKQPDNSIPLDPFFNSPARYSRDTTPARTAAPGTSPATPSSSRAGGTPGPGDDNSTAGQKDYNLWAKDLADDGQTSAVDIIVQWICEPGNYDLYQNGDTKAKNRYAEEVIELMVAAGCKATRTVNQVKGKIRTIQSNWRKADQEMKATGNGSTNEDLTYAALDEEGRKEHQVQIKKRAAFLEKHRKNHPHYDVLSEVFGSRTGDSPKYMIDSSIDDSLTLEDHMGLAASSQAPSNVSQAIGQQYYPPDDPRYDPMQDPEYLHTMSRDRELSDGPESETDNPEGSSTQLSSSTARSLTASISGTSSTIRGQTGPADRDQTAANIARAQSSRKRKRKDEESPFAPFAVALEKANDLDASWQASEQDKRVKTERMERERLDLDQARFKEEQRQNDMKIKKMELEMKIETFKAFVAAGVEAGEARTMAGL